MSDPDVVFSKLQPTRDERMQPLRAQLGIASFGLNLISLLPRQRGRIHSHRQQEEVYLVISGRLTLLVDEVPHTMCEGEIVRVAPHVRRQLVNRSRERVVVLALGGTGEHKVSGIDGQAWASWDETGEGHVPREMPLPPDLDESELD